MKKKFRLRPLSPKAMDHCRGALIVSLCALLFLAGSYYTRDQMVAVSNMQQERELPVYCVQTEKPQVALSFDAAWGNEDTQNILNILAAHNVKATFFMTGGWVDSYPEDVKRIAAAGHDLGNHSQNHKNMSQLSATQQKEEIMQVHERVKALTGIDMELFRPPYGDYDNSVIRTAKACGYLPIQWDVDSLDWKDYGADSIVRTVTENRHLGNGSIILMHNGAKYTAQALDSVITKLQEQGFELVPISQLVYRDNYTMDSEGRQIPASLSVTGSLSLWQQAGFFAGPHTAAS
ncbi:MAG: polysaccharide deacetylase family protein [Lachnospiraceae bacterium]|nr:polysaccharide deacetylase family protein [Lachnospiraceae bacterium]